MDWQGYLCHQTMNNLFQNLVLKLEIWNPDYSVLFVFSK
jgi:hypothetical protein